MSTIGWRGECPNDGTTLAVRLTPTDNVMNGLMPEPSRMIEMFAIEAKCQECGQWVTPENLRAAP